MADFVDQTVNVSLYDDASESAVTTTSGSGKRGLDVISLNLVNDTRFDPDDSNPNYIGLNQTKGAATSGATWTIFKFIKSGQSVTQIQKIENAVWDNRTSIF